MRIALTSCREHSRRLYRKELNMLGPKTVMEYTLDQMIECKEFFDLMIFTTDWKEILDRFRDSYPEITFLERPKELALSETPAQDYITFTLEPYHQEGNEYVLLQATSPLRDTDLIFDTYEAFSYKGFEPQFNSVFTVNRYSYETDGQIYWFRDYTDIFKGPGVPYICDPSVDLDYPYNLRFAEAIVRGDLYGL